MRVLTTHMGLVKKADSVPIDQPESVCFVVKPQPTTHDMTCVSWLGKCVY